MFSHPGFHHKIRSDSDIRHNFFCGTQIRVKPLVKRRISVGSADLPASGLQLRIYLRARRRRISVFSASGFWRLRLILERLMGDLLCFLGC